MNVQTDLVNLYRRPAHEIELPDFSAPVAFTYNPLIYAQVPHESNLKRYGNSKKRVRFFGMNPGSWGMGQTGIPFGDITSVRAWSGITGPVRKPSCRHVTNMQNGVWNIIAGIHKV